MRELIVGLLTVLVLIGGIECDQDDGSTKDKTTRKTGVESRLAMDATSQLMTKHSIRKRQLGGLFGPGAHAQASAFNHRPGLGLGLGLGPRLSHLGADSIFGRVPGAGLGLSAANSAAQGLHLGPAGITGASAQAGSQGFSLGNHRINIAHSNDFSIENGRPRLLRGSSISIT